MKFGSIHAQIPSNLSKRGFCLGWLVIIHTLRGDGHMVTSEPANKEAADEEDSEEAMSLRRCRHIICVVAASSGSAACTSGNFSNKLFCALSLTPLININSSAHTRETAVIAPARSPQLPMAIVRTDASAAHLPGFPTVDHCRRLAVPGLCRHEHYLEPAAARAPALLFAVHAVVDWLRAAPPLWRSARHRLLSRH